MEENERLRRLAGREEKAVRVEASEAQEPLSTTE
jgi:hypothetical protein